MSHLFIVPFLIFVYLCTKLSSQFAKESLVERLLLSFVLFTACIISTGFVLSGLDLTANTFAWSVAVLVPLLAFYFLASLLGIIKTKTSATSTRTLAANRLKTALTWYAGLSVYLRWVFGILFMTVLALGVTNFVLVVFTVPNEWDSMTGHLNRVVQYIQRGTMAHFGGTNWNMDTYPKSICTIQIYSYLMTGRVENAFKIIHFLSYWVSVVAIFGISQRIFKNLSASFFCALAYALFLDLLMQAVTTETDVVLTAYLSCLLFFLFSYYQSRRDVYLYLSGIVFAVALGHKITFLLLLPSVFVVMLYTVFWNFDQRKTWRVHRFIHWNAVVKLGVSIVVSGLIWTLPTGYLKNIEVFGHPIGPPTALKHQSVERAGTPRNLLKQGSRNVVRYGYDFFNLDGIRNIAAGAELNRSMRGLAVRLENKLGLYLDEVTDFTILPFSFERRFEYYNANPYWGIWGFGLVFPLIFMVLFGIVPSRVHYFLGVAVSLHFLALSFSAPYDPFKGRYFIETGVFAVLFLGLLFTHPTVKINVATRIVGKSYVALVSVLACLSGFMIVYFNVRCLPFDALGYRSAVGAPRLPYILWARPDVIPAYELFDEIVPENAMVALGTINDDFEYPLYGKNLSRRLIAINPFEQGVQPIPKEADFLFFSKNVIAPQKGDIRLGTDTTVANPLTRGEDYYLRKLR